jgi:hypothetical protein
VGVEAEDGAPAVLVSSGYSSSRTRRRRRPQARRPLVSSRAAGTDGAPRGWRGGLASGSVIASLLAFGRAARATLAASRTLAHGHQHFRRAGPRRAVIAQEAVRATTSGSSSSSTGRPGN